MTNLSPSQLAVVRKMMSALEKIDRLVQGYGPNFDTRKIAQEALTAAKAEFPDE